MERIFLSICMPVYNGGAYLSEALSSLAAQCTDPLVIGQVEIVCCDDGSKDESVQIIKHFQVNCPNITLLINEKNIGFDRNVDKVLTQSRGLFRWVLSQDEVVMPGSLKLLLELLKANPEVSYVCISNTPNKEGEKDAQFFRNGSELLETLGMRGGLLSQNIYNAAYLPANRQKYYGNLWFHYSMALEIIANRPLFFVKNLFVSTDHPSAWAKGGLAFYTFTNLKKIVQGLSSLGYQKEVIDKQLRGFARDLPRTVASAKLHGLAFKVDVFKILFYEFYFYPLALLSAVGVYMTPVRVLRFVKKMAGQAR